VERHASEFCGVASGAASLAFSSPRARASMLWSPRGQRRTPRESAETRRSRPCTEGEAA
jgi:hypothetical protein